jgi:exonuclease SbcD
MSWGLVHPGIRAVLLHGNHDAESRLTRKLRVDEAHVFPSRGAKTIRFEDLGVALHGRSFKDRETTDNLGPGYPKPVDGMLNVGVLHTTLEGNPQHSRYGPYSLLELSNKGYEYHGQRRKKGRAPNLRAECP